MGFQAMAIAWNPNFFMICPTQGVRLKFLRTNRLPGWLLPFLVGPAVMGLISLMAWILLAGGLSRGPQRIEYTIPDGTAKQVAAGKNVEIIPETATFVVGDQIVVHNLDSVVHVIGPFFVPARSTALTVLSETSYSLAVCSVHSSGTIGLEVQPAYSLMLTLLPTLALGVPIGITLVVIRRVLNSL